MTTGPFSITLPDSSETTTETLNIALVKELVMHGQLKSVTTSAEPGAPTEFDFYYVPAGATGTDWGSNTQKLTVYFNANWEFWDCPDGFASYVEDENDYKMHDSGTWYDLVATVV